MDQVIQFMRGGVSGCNSGTVSFSWSTGDVKSSGIYYSYSGGLIAQNSGKISNCYATGNVESSFRNSSSRTTTYGGGLVGINSGNVYFSFATGDVTVWPGAFTTSTSTTYYAYAGGLVGSHTGLVLGCFATGSIKSYITGYQTYFGSLVGKSNGTFAMSFGYVGQVLPNGHSTGEGGCTFLQLNDKDFYLNELGWNADYWDLSNLDFLNGLYPKLVK